MTFERFNTSGSSWVETAGPAPGDPRVHDALCRIEEMEQQSRPAVLSERQWFHLLRDTRHVAEKWLSVALDCGWSMLDLFGVPPHPKGHVGFLGVAPILRGRLVSSVDANRITIDNRLGEPNVRYRCPPGASALCRMPGSVLVWDALNMEGWA